MANMIATMTPDGKVYYDWEMFPVIAEFPWVVKINYKTLKTSSNADNIIKKLKDLGYYDLIVYNLIGSDKKPTQYWEIRFRKEIDLTEFKTLNLHKD